MAQPIETPPQRTARLRQEALAAFYSNRAAHQHDVPNYVIGQGTSGSQPGPMAQADNRGWLQRLLDAMGGNPSGK